MILYELQLFFECVNTNKNVEFEVEIHSCIIHVVAQQIKRVCDHFVFDLIIFLSLFSL